VDRGWPAFPRSELSGEERTDSLASIRPVGITVSGPFDSRIEVRIDQRAAVGAGACGRCNLLLLRQVTPLRRHHVVYFCSGAYTQRASSSLAHRRRC